EEHLISGVVEFGALPVAGAVVELDGTIVTVNDAWAALVGQPQLAGRKIWDFAPGLDRAWPDLIAPGEHVGEMTLATARGPRTIEYALSARDAGARRVIVFVALDITRHKRAAALSIEHERQVAASQRLESLGLVAGGMAHELNNLLVSVVAE